MVTGNHTSLRVHLPNFTPPPSTPPRFAGLWYDRENPETRIAGMWEQVGAEEWTGAIVDVEWGVAWEVALVE